MSAAPARRGFLRGLLTLPVIGGGVTLIGKPTAVAEPVTLDLLLEYDAWLEQERYRTQVETYGHPDRPMAYGRASRANEWHQQSVAQGRPPSTRASLVLSAVGHDWRR